MSHVPELRFSEFASTGSAQVLGEWEEKSLGDVSTFYKGKGISKADISDDGVTPCIRYGQLYTDYGTVIDEVISTTNVDPNKLYLSKGGEILIPASGETSLDIATTSMVKNKGVALGGDLNIIESDNDGVFIANYLSNKKKIDIARLAQGNSVVHLYSSQLKTIQLSIPPLPEQQKIATFLSTVDKKLGHLRRKHELLESYKRGIMQKIFPSTGTSTSSTHRSGQAPELHFKQDASTSSAARSKVAEPVEAFPDWEEKRLGDISELITKGTTPTSVGFGFKKEGINFIKAESISKNGFINIESTPKVSIECDESLKRSRLEVGDILFSIAGTLGRTAIVKEKDLPANTNQALAIVRLIPSANNKFVNYVLNQSSTKKYIFQSLSIGAQPNLNLQQVGDIKIVMPSPEEQQKIANFLSTLDKKLEAVQKQINQTEVFKKGLLQKMFV